MLYLPVWLTRVQSNSMAPSLRDGQLVWTLRTRRKDLTVRGTVVAVDSRELGRRIIKRIVGLPGEHIRMDGRAVFVDGYLLSEPYATISSAYRGAFHVPDGHYLLLGDDRDTSSDSRSWRHPYVARTEIVGRLLTTNSALVATLLMRGRERTSHPFTG
jgi:signal peptidase I